MKGLALMTIIKFRDLVMLRCIAEFQVANDGASPRQEHLWFKGQYQHAGILNDFIRENGITAFYMANQTGLFAGVSVVQESAMRLRQAGLLEEGTYALTKKGQEFDVSLPDDWTEWELEYEV